ncbi:MAG: hypothetical protein LUE93_01785 [Bacteroides sp.]|nr:hypothetical protein [Bacteroides sp.]
MRTTPETDLTFSVRSKHFAVCFLSILLYPLFSINAQERIWPDKDIFYLPKPALLVRPDEEKHSIHLHANHPELKRYTGRWEWRSEEGDTLLVVEIINKKIYQQTEHYQGAKTFDQKRKKHILRSNILCGVYEYSIRDSVLFSNVAVLPDIGNTIYPLDTDKKRNLLIGLFNQEQRKTHIFLKLYKNPLAPSHQGVIKISLTDRKKGIAEWEMYRQGKETLNHIVIHPSTPQEMILPTRIILTRTKK